MLFGLMDHWVPSHDAISRFWKTPFDELRPMLDKLCDDIPINNFTFYTKWYTNGIKSELPFLQNRPEAMNTVTDNAWGHQLIEYFHKRDITVGAMLQCYTFDEGSLPDEAKFGTWDVSTATGLDRGVDIALPTWDGYSDMLRRLLEEHLEVYPDLDAVFLEFEGLVGVGYQAGTKKLGLDLESGIVPVSPAIDSMWEDLEMIPPDSHKWVWYTPVQKVFKRALRKHLAVAEDVFKRVGYEGIRGIVFKAMGYELPYVLDCLPGNDWWLLPWWYWGWGAREPLSERQLRRQMGFCKNWFGVLKDAGYRVSFIGNATLPTVNPETIGDMLEYCIESDMAGHIGMGNFLPEVGLRWHKATEESVAAARDIYLATLDRLQS